MAKSIMSHRVHRGSLVHQIADVQFVDLKQALCAASAAHGVQDLQAQRTAVLATMKANIRDEAAFSAASRQEAELAAQIRHIRRYSNGKDVPLTADDQYIFQRASERQEREYRIADREDAEIARQRLQFGGVAFNVAKGAVMIRTRKAKRVVKPFFPMPTLPAIRIRVARQDWGVVVEYVGPSLRHLHAAGCVTDRTMKLWANGVKGGMKFRDENGDGFRRWPRRSRTYPQGVHVTRNVHHERNYRALPGVSLCGEYVRTTRHEARRTAQINTLQVRP